MSKSVRLPANLFATWLRQSSFDQFANLEFLFCAGVHKCSFVGFQVVLQWAHQCYVVNVELWVPPPLFASGSILGSQLLFLE